MTFVLIMAGGEGKRLRPLTEKTPKPMLPINGHPMLHWIVKKFLDQDFQNISISVGYKSEQIKKYFGHAVGYIQEDSPLGTAGPLGLLPKLKEPIIVVNGDVLTSVDYKAMLRFHKNHNSIMTIGSTTHAVQIPFGVLKMNETNLKKIDEKPQYNFPISAGVYVLSPQALAYLPEGSCDMPDFIQALLDANQSVSVFPLSGEWLDVGRPEDYAIAQLSELA